MARKQYLRSGELATLAGVSPDTLRHYERMKLLAVPPRSSGNYRMYPLEAVERIRLIRHALAARILDRGVDKDLESPRFGRSAV
jgi:DNA-binding transcriptional MerR regulator